LGIAQALIPSCILLCVPHNRIFGGVLEGVWRRGCRVQCARFGLRVCEKSTEVHAAGTGDFLESRRAKTHMTQVWINTARCKHARAIGLGEGRGPTWPLGTHHVDGGVWNAWVCACANHTRPTRGTRRELGSEVNRNEELVNIYRQTPHKSSQEVSRLRWVLLGTAAQRCRNSL
jgi:hypothetical protein